MTFSATRARMVRSQEGAALSWQRGPTFGAVGHGDRLGDGFLQQQGLRTDTVRLSEHAAFDRFARLHRGEFDRESLFKVADDPSFRRAQRNPRANGGPNAARHGGAGQ